MPDKSGPLKAVFLDRDGVINRDDEGYPHKPSELILFPHVGKALRALKDAGFKLLVITNQSGIARGLYKIADMHQFHAAIQQQLETDSVQIDAFYYCPHHPDGVNEYAVTCACRKPATENLERAIREHNIDPKISYFVGDRISDIACGDQLGVPGIQIYAKDHPEQHSRAIATVEDLYAATRIILGESDV